MHWADRRASVAVPDSAPGRPNDWNCPKEAVPGIGETAPDARLATRRGAASSSTSATSAIRIELAQR